MSVALDSASQDANATPLMVKDMDTFNQCAGNALVHVMNSPLGQELTDKLLALKLAENLRMTQEEWTAAKQGLLVYMFAELLKSEPPLMREYAGHMYRLLRGDE